MFRFQRKITKYALPLLALLAAGSCSNPIAPNPPQQLTISGPETGLPNRAYTFIATVNFTSQAMIYYRWSFDDSVFISRVTPDSSAPVIWKFKTFGIHVIKAAAYRTGDNALLCSAIDTFTAYAFAMSIIADSATGLVNFPITFRAIPSPPQNFGNYTLVWLFDSTRIARQGHDTVSYPFSTAGQHSVKAFYIDSLGEILAKATTIVTTEGVTLSISASPQQPIVLSKTTFTLLHLGFELPRGYQILWSFDSMAVIRSKTDSISYAFGTLGHHTILITLIDSTGRALGSAFTTVNINAIPFSISISPSTATALSPVVLSLHIENPPAGAFMHWDFGDGTSVDTTLTSFRYNYRLVGNFRIRAELFKNGSLLGSDSDQVTVAPLLQGFDPSLLASLHRARVVFSGNIGATGSAPCSPPGTTFETDSISWTGFNFSSGYSRSFDNRADTTSSHWYTEITSSDAFNMNGDFSSDGMTLNSIQTNISHSNSSTTYQGAWAYSSSESEAAHTGGHLLQLMWFTPDSAEYAIFGTNLGSKVSFNSDCGATWAPNGYSGDIVCSVDWTAYSSLIVTLFKK